MSLEKLITSNLGSQINRFLKKLNTSQKECWEYRGAKYPNGYAKVGRNGKTWLAHRYAWAKLVGDIPEGKLVLHKCDNRACCNPEHLFIGTHQDNMDDMIRKGRHDFRYLRTGPWVENLPRKYSDIQKDEMVRLRVGDKLPLADVALLYGTSDKYVSKLCRMKLGADYLRFRVAE